MNRQCTHPTRCRPTEEVLRQKNPTMAAVLMCDSCCSQVIRTILAQEAAR